MSRTSEYARLPYRSRFPKPDVTATVVFIHPRRGCFCGIRGPDVDTFPNKACAAGGFIEPKWDRPPDEQIPEDMRDDMPPAQAGERIEQTAIREAKEEMDLDIDESRLVLFHVSSDPLTDPRAHVVNVCYIVVLTDEEADRIDAAEATAGRIEGHDDLSGAFWMDRARYESGKDDFAFDHREIHGIALDFYDSRLA